MAVSAADKLKALKSVTKTKEKAPAKNEIRTIDFTGTTIESTIAKLCEAAYLGNQFEPIIKQHHAAVQEVLFERWTQEMWDNRKLPANFKARLKKTGSDGVATTFDDMACNFLMKFRTDCLKTKLPKASDLPEDKSVHEVLTDTLVAMGLSKDNAHKFAQEEFEVVESTGLPEGGLDAMLASSEGTPLRAVGDFILSCITASAKELSKLKPLTDEQRAVAMETTQSYKVKEGVEERLLGYVESLDQLRKLLTFMSVTKQVSNFEFGISDEVKERNKRLTEIAGRYINLTK